MGPTRSLTQDCLRYLFEMCDRNNLRAAGDPLPGFGPFVMYRGIAGIGRQRRPRGLSWTSSLECARWFAERSGLQGLANTAVVTITVPDEDVLAYTNSPRVRIHRPAP